MRFHSAPAILLILLAWVAPTGAATNGAVSCRHAGPAFEGRGRADRLVVDFMGKYSIPGASIAISKGDRVVYSAAFGWADEARSVPMRTDHRLRTASCSKPLTSIALMRMAEQGRVDLDVSVFGREGLLKGRYGLPHFEGKPTDVTVRQLLRHASGGWGNSGSDPIFAFHDQPLDQIVKRTLAERPLTNSPGTHYSYSNFGYAVLGLIMEAITGTNYEAAVREWVLVPCGAPGMRISAARGSKPGPDEVHYFSQGGNAYGVRPEIMQAHGGWIATPAEFLRVLDRVDGHGVVDEILPPGRISEMTTEGVAGSGYALGWAVNRHRNWWHMGSLPGTSAVVVRTELGYNWAVFMNSRSPAAGFDSALDGLVWEILKAIPSWPEGLAD